MAEKIDPLEKETSPATAESGEALSRASLRQVLTGTWARFSKAGGMRSGAAVAFYAAFSVAPLLVVLTGIMTWLYGNDEAQRALLESLRGLIGNRETETLADIIANAPHLGEGDDAGGGKAVLGSAIALVTTIFGATGVFIELRGALQSMLGRVEEAWSWWSLVRIRLLAVGVVLGCGFVMTAALFAQTLALFALQWTATRWSLLAPIIAAFEALWTWLVITVLFAIIMRWLPDGHLPRRPAFVGAAVAASLFMVGRYAISLYVARTVLQSPLGAASSFAALLMWFFWSSQIFLIGAGIAAELSDRATGSAGERKKKPESSRESGDWA